VEIAGRCSPRRIADLLTGSHTDGMANPPADDVERVPIPTTPTRPTDDARPTVDQMSEWSFPASDPPATWTWDVERPPRDASP
jgi:hypothetical protein